MVGFCEHGNKPTDSKQGLIDQLSRGNY